MEKTLFDWRGYDALDMTAFIFYECVVKVPIEIGRAHV